MARIALVLLVISFLLSGCGGGGAQPNASVSAQIQQSQGAEDSPGFDCPTTMSDSEHFDAPPLPPDDELLDVPPPPPSYD